MYWLRVGHYNRRDHLRNRIQQAWGSDRKNKGFRSPSTLPLFWKKKMHIPKEEVTHPEKPRWTCGWRIRRLTLLPRRWSRRWSRRTTKKLSRRLLRRTTEKFRTIKFARRLSRRTKKRCQEGCDIAKKSCLFWWFIGSFMLFVSYGWLIVFPTPYSYKTLCPLHTIMVNILLFSDSLYSCISGNISYL